MRNAQAQKEQGTGNHQPTSSMSQSNPAGKGGKAATLISRKLLDQAKSAKNARVTPKGRSHCKHSLILFIHSHFFLPIQASCRNRRKQPRLSKKKGSNHPSNRQASLERTHSSTRRGASNNNKRPRANLTSTSTAPAIPPARCKETTSP